MKLLQMSDRERFATMSTQELRETFLIQDLFRRGELSLTYVDLDRAVVGSAVPLDKPLELPCPEELRAHFFTERRELGILNVGGAGQITVNGHAFDLAPMDALYVGRGDEGVVFSSSNPESPAEFYLLSYPAHAAHPTCFIDTSSLDRVNLGAPETANAREITKLIHMKGARSCQLVMGYTQLASGSVWNTMPPHTHMRRSEIYFYFNISEENRVLHLMGPPEETRHLVVADRQVVISPGWSIHAGAGTSNYTFCWGMGGENQAYDDMDAVYISDLL